MTVAAGTDPRPTARATVTAVLADVTGRSDLGVLEDGTDLVEALDLDSVDFLEIVSALEDRLGVDLPPSVYPRLSTLAGLVEVVDSTLPG